MGIGKPVTVAASATGSDNLILGREGQVARVSGERTRAEAEAGLLEADEKANETPVVCGKHSAAGSVSQRACVFCGSRVVLYPVADALHLIHGPIGCAAYTWDIRGSVSSGPQLHRLSFSTDLQETDVIFGGEKKLAGAIRELVEQYKPQAAFIYSTCIVGLIGDDVDAVCRKLTTELGIPVISVHSEGFKGTKKDGYYAACQALFSLMGTGDTSGISKVSINILGEFNLAGEAWIIKEYYRRMGVEVVAIMTGDGRVEDIRRAHGATLNVVQCSGSMTSLAKMMKEKYGIPFKRVSYFGIEDMAKALYEVAEHFADEHPEVLKAAKALVREEMADLMPKLVDFRKKLEGRKAAIYVGGGFKAFSLVKALRHLGIQTVLVGSQTGAADDYSALKALCDPGTVIVDDSNPRELSKYCRETGAELFIGGVKERPLALKLGMGFCDHNHERKIALAGFAGMYNFAKEVYASLTSPVWKFARPGFGQARPGLPGAGKDGSAAAGTGAGLIEGVAEDPVPGHPEARANQSAGNQPAGSGHPRDLAGARGRLPPALADTPQEDIHV